MPIRTCLRISLSNPLEGFDRYFWNRSQDLLTVWALLQSTKTLISPILMEDGTPRGLGRRNRAWPPYSISSRPCRWSEWSPEHRRPQKSLAFDFAGKACPPEYMRDGSQVIRCVNSMKRKV